MTAKDILGVYPLETNPGPLAMALDEVLLEKAARGSSSLRFYQWQKPTVSLGYFQPHIAGDHFPGLPLVRRPTGGDLLIHHHELTYALALPDSRIPGKPEELACLVHRVIAKSLNVFGVETTCQPVKTRLAPGDAPPGVLCFLHPAAGDVMVSGAKVVGSAQRRKAGALVQHGSILLASSPFAMWLKGIRELAGVTVDPGELARNLVLEIPRALAGQGILLQEEAMGWTDSERQSAVTIATSRYENPEWTNRR